MSHAIAVVGLFYPETFFETRVFSLLTQRTVILSHAAWTVYDQDLTEPRIRTKFDVDNEQRLSFLRVFSSDIPIVLALRFSLLFAPWTILASSLRALLAVFRQPTAIRLGRSSNRGGREPALCESRGLARGHRPLEVERSCFARTFWIFPGQLLELVVVYACVQISANSSTPILTYCKQFSPQKKADEIQLTLLRWIGMWALSKVIEVLIRKRSFCKTVQKYYCKHFAAA